MLVFVFSLDMEPEMVVLEMGPSLGSARARPGPAFFWRARADILRRAQARSRLGLESLRRAQKIGAFMQ